MSGRVKLPIADIMAWEEGKLSPSRTLHLFSKVIKGGYASHLQGVYGRTAKNLVSSGLLTKKGEITAEAKRILKRK